MTEETPKKRGRGRPPGAKNKPKDGAPVKAAKVTENARISVEDLTEDQHLCLLLQHDRKIATAEAALKVAQTAVKNARNLVKGKLGPDALKQILLMRSLQTDYGQTALKSLMGMQVQVARWAGMPIGHTDDLFAEDRTPSVDKAFEEGKRAGMAGEDAKPPTTYGMAQQQDWMKGYHVGHEVNVDLLRNMPKPAGRDLDEGLGEGNYGDFDKKPTAESVFGSGPKDPEHNVGENHVPPNWRERGMAMYHAGEPRAVPEDCPEDCHEELLSAWDNAQSAAGARARRGLSATAH